MAEWRAAETAEIEAPLGTPEYERAVKLADDTRNAFIACLDAATGRNGPETQEAALAAVISPPLPEASMDMTDEYRCRGCGGQLRAQDEVRAVYRELTDPEGGHPSGEFRWGYTHLGHEPAGTDYRITGRGRLLDLERERQDLDGGRIDPEREKPRLGDGGEE